jgi:hypothetical protein
MANLERAARITGRALLMVQQTSVAAQATYSMAESVQMFNELKDEILFAHPNIDKAQLEAKDLFKKTGDQTGLAFVARVLLTKATDTKKGHSFKKVEEYLCDCFKLVADDGKLPCEELVLCRIELVANWQLNQNKGPICWERFEGDLLQIVRTPHFAPDVIWTFYLAVAEYNQGKFNEAEGRFQWLRNRNLPSQNRHRIRCFYLGDKSTPKIFEGKVTRGSHVRFIYSGELGTDVRVDRDEFEERPDEVKHFKIGFSFYGPLAVDRNS